MHTYKPLADIRIGDELEGFYLLSSCSQRISSNGKPFLSAVLSDRTRSVDAKVWDYSGPLGAADAGRPVKVRGTVTEFRGSFQINVDRIRLTGPQDSVDFSALIPTAPIDADALYEELLSTVASMEDADYRAICTEMLRRHGDALRTIPAAKSVHHSFRCGLLMHTAYMLRLAGFIASLYHDTVDRSLLLAGTLLHDFGKTAEFNFSPLGLVTDYSVEGQLLGHLVICAQEVGEVAAALAVPEEKSILLRHLILSHHGEPEFGAAVRPQCVEGELLSYIDMIDSRVEICREALSETAAGAFSERIFALDGRRIYRHDT